MSGICGAKHDFFIPNINKSYILQLQIAPPHKYCVVFLLRESSSTGWQEQNAATWLLPTE